MTYFISPNHKAVFGLTLAVFVLTCVTVWVGLTSPERTRDDDTGSIGKSLKISNFKECEDAGYPIMESYPRQCRSADGALFVEDIDPVAEVWGSISGTVMLGPTCPVMREPPDPDCADRPYSGKFNLVKASNEQIVKTFNSDAQGKFSFAVTAGQYIIRPVSVAIFPRCSESDVIKVGPSANTEVSISCDTGIR